MYIKLATMISPVTLIGTLLLCAVVQSQIQLRRLSRDNLDEKSTEVIRASLRSTFGIRPFQKSEGNPEGPKTTESSTDPNKNELHYEEKPSRVWVPGGLSFSCKGRTPGYYSDPSPLSKCQVYHMCMPDGRRYSMLCGVGTIFNQITFVCDHWYNYNCENAESDYSRNDRLWDDSDEEEGEEVDENASGNEDDDTTEPGAE